MIGIVKKVRPVGSLCRSYTGTMPGCSRQPVTLASSTNREARLSRSSSPAGADPLDSTFIANSRRNTVSKTRSATPMPPRPSSPSTV
jgi:hypothetical protein